MSEIKAVETVQGPDMDLSPVNQLADALARGARYVQGAGGNLSVKSAKVLWVKASGTRFSDARTSRIFVPMDLARTRERALLAERLEDCVLRLEGSEGLRPSIESAFHALLAQRFVLHVHSVGAIAAGAERSRRLLGRLDDFGRLFFVPYARPGLPLAQALVATGATETPPEAPTIVLLQNHGLIVAAPSAEDCLRLVTAVEHELGAEEPRPLALGDRHGIWERRLPTGSVSKKARAVLTGGVLTPDSAVFLGPVPFSVELNQTRSSCVIDESGALWTRSGLSDDALQVARSLISVGDLAQPPTTYLSGAQVQELLGWDAEAWRKGQER